MTVEEKKRKRNYNWIWIIGIFLVVGGVILSYIFCKDYFTQKHNFFSNSSNIQDLGTLLAGTAGLLFTLASIAFFVYTLIQTRHEIELQQQEMKDTRKVMEEQRDAFQLQTNITSFYNLLSNHREFCASLRTENLDGFDYIDSVHSSLTGSLGIFRTSLQTGFDHVDYTLFQPTNIVFNHSEFFSSWVPNVLQIVDFIEKHLNAEYHKILFASLVEQERYLLGFIIQNRINAFSLEFTDKIHDYFGSIKYNYARSYCDSGKTYFEPTLHNYVPLMTISLDGLIEERIDNMDLGKILNCEATSTMVVNITNLSDEVPILIDQVKVIIKLKRKHYTSHAPFVNEFKSDFNVGLPLKTHCRLDIRSWIPKEFMEFLLRENQHFPTQDFKAEIGLRFTLINTDCKKAFDIEQKVYLDLDPIQGSREYKLQYYRQK